MFFAEWGHIFVLSSFAAALFLGGWRLPGVEPSAQLSTLRLQVLGAVLFQVKCWLVVFTVLWIRWVLPRVRVDQLMSVCWRFFMPLALATLVLTVLWVSGLQIPVVRSLQETLSLIVFALSMFAVGYFLRRVLVNLRSTSAQVNVNPWL
jgi:NADH-quinone oxidoreductase subunit H